MRVKLDAPFIELVLDSMPAPAWLDANSNLAEIVLSSRARFARNLVGFPFPHRASLPQRTEICSLVTVAVEQSKLALEIQKFLSPPERLHLIANRLISPEFSELQVGQMVIVNKERSVSLMVNEEDHLRFQAITAGWSPREAAKKIQGIHDGLSKHLPLAYDENLGFVTASPTNLGGGRRHSAMMHLAGLVFTKRIHKVLNAIQEQDVVIRGLFGENSRAVGAFFQISTTSTSIAPFIGACEFLIEEEQLARKKLDREKLHIRCQEALHYILTSREVTYVDALRTLAWVRLACAIGDKRYPIPFRDVDLWLTLLRWDTSEDTVRANRKRADFLRKKLDHAMDHNFSLQ